jgi:saccharopine dehydrogenase-like NADP-dependent oxidoreductase
LDVNNNTALEEEVAAYDVVISLIPYTHHANVIKAAIKGKTHVVTTSYVSPAMKELDAEAKAAGIVVMNEIGLDPGIDHLYAVKIIDEVHQKGGKVRHISSLTPYTIGDHFRLGQAIPFILRWTPCTRGLRQPIGIQILLVFTRCTPSVA